MTNPNGIAEPTTTEYDYLFDRFDTVEMADFPQFEYSMKQVLRAGEALAGEIPWSEDRAEEIQEIFRIANNFRDSHAYPMWKLRHEMVGKIRRYNLGGITAARLKRMSSIRKKLHNIPEKLNQIQDLGGCRAIVPAMGDVARLLSAYSQDTNHGEPKPYDYISNPKIGGYRSHHLVYKFCGIGESEVFNGRRIEIQIRTRLQHSWATAVEAVGLMRSEDMKAGSGNQEWLRLFELMSGEFALAESCPEPLGSLPRKERVSEIIDLDGRLHAINTLQNLSNAVRFIDTNYRADNRPEYYLIEYDNENKTVRVKGFDKARAGTNAYDLREGRAEKEGSGHINVVLVAADEVENLRAAYPNYFGDVRLFCKNLRDITRGKEAKEYTMPPQEVAPRQPKVVPDLSWFKRFHKR